MNGEFGLKIKRIIIQGPYYVLGKGRDKEPNFDLTLVDENNGCLHICGDNNIPRLLQEGLREYYKNRKRR